MQAATEENRPQAAIGDLFSQVELLCCTPARHSWWAIKCIKLPRMGLVQVPDTVGSCCESLTTAAPSHTGLSDGDRKEEEDDVPVQCRSHENDDRIASSKWADWQDRWIPSKHCKVRPRSLLWHCLVHGPEPSSPEFLSAAEITSFIETGRWVVPVNPSRGTPPPAAQNMKLHFPMPKTDQ